VVKSCDAKGVVGLVRENQLAREDVLLLGVPCTGLWGNGQLASKCYACTDEVSPLADRTITAEGELEGSVTSETERAVAPDPRDAQIAFLESLPAESRWNYWHRQFALCIRCYACRAVCPLCYCATCIAEKHRPQWIPTSFDGPGNTAWNIARAMHLAGRCIGCDECTRVCPADIRLDLLNRRLEQEIETQFDYESGNDPGTEPPLTTFRPEDPDQFM
jgi:ferredoxin